MAHIQIAIKIPFGTLQFWRSPIFYSQNIDMVWLYGWLSMLPEPNIERIWLYFLWDIRTVLIELFVANGNVDRYFMFRVIFDGCCNISAVSRKQNERLMHKVSESVRERRRGRDCTKRTMKKQNARTYLLPSMPIWCSIHSWFVYSVYYAISSVSAWNETDSDPDIWELTIFHEQIFHFSSRVSEQ